MPFSGIPLPRSAHLTSAALQFGVGRSPYKKRQEKIFLCASTTKIFSWRFLTLLSA